MARSSAMASSAAMITLSVGVNTASTLAEIRAAAAATTSSLVLAVCSTQVMPCCSRYALASAMGLVELGSDREYSSPTLETPGSCASIMSRMYSVFSASLVPVT